MSNHIISRADAKAKVLRYQADSKSGKIKGGKFPVESVVSILNLPGCIALRYYFAQQDDGENTIVLMGEDATGTIIGDLYIDNAPPCPPYCPGNPID